MKVWDAYEKIYDKLWVQKVSLKPTRDKIMDHLRQMETEYETVLDMGCGTGQLLAQIRDHLHKDKIMGVEPSKLREVARKRNISVVEGTIESFNTTQTYDIVLCTHSFPYYQDQRAAIEKLMSLTKKGGYLMLAHASSNTLYDKLLLLGVKLTTSKAHYPSETEMLGYLAPYSDQVEIRRINGRGIPSIQLFIVQRR